MPTGSQVGRTDCREKMQNLHQVIYTSFVGQKKWDLKVKRWEKILIIIHQTGITKETERDMNVTENE